MHWGQLFSPAQRVSNYDIKVITKAPTQMMSKKQGDGMVPPFMELVGAHGAYQGDKEEHGGAGALGVRSEGISSH